MNQVKAKAGAWVLLPVAVLLCGLLWGQGQDGAAASGDAKAAGTSAASGQTDTQGDYVIGAEDVLAINVWKEPDISRSVTVRLDGAHFAAAGGRGAGRGQDHVAAEKRDYPEAEELHLGAGSGRHRAADDEQALQRARRSDEAGIVSADQLNHGARCDCAGRGLPGFCQAEIHLRAAPPRRWHRRSAAV